MAGEELVSAGLQKEFVEGEEGEMTGHGSQRLQDESNASDIVDEYDIDRLLEVHGSDEDRSSIVEYVATRLQNASGLYVLTRPDLAVLLAKAVSAAQASKTLCKINLSRCRLGVEGVHLLAEGLPSGLKVLELSDSKIGDDGASMLARCLPKGLQDLRLEGNHIGAKGGCALVAGLPESLKVLRLGNNAIGAKGVGFHGADLPLGLQELSLDNNGIRAEAARTLAVGLPERLQELSLNRNGMGDEGAIALAEVGLPEGLQTLYLEVNCIGAEGACALVAGLPLGLKELMLARNDIGVKGVGLRGADLPRGLQHLNLEQNGIGAEAAGRLAVGLPEGLERLNLTGNGIRDEGAIALMNAGLPAGLERLKLDGNGIGYVGACALVRGLSSELCQALKLSDDEAEKVLAWVGRELVVQANVRCVVGGDNFYRAERLLEDNRRRVAELARLEHVWDGKWVRPQHARVVLCGDGEVGKTLLRTALSAVVKGRWTGNRKVGGPTPAKLQRTRGVEVEHFPLGELGSIAMWDFGGQKEFHVLHGHLMPDKSFAKGGASLFVLVIKVSAGACGADAAVQALKHWIRRIKSTTLPGSTRHVLVVLNRWEGVTESLAELLCVRKLTEAVPDGIVFLEPQALDVRHETAAIPLWRKMLLGVERALENVAAVPDVTQKVAVILRREREQARAVGAKQFQKMIMANMPKDKAAKVSEVLGDLAMLLQDQGCVVQLQRLLEPTGDEGKELGRPRRLTWLSLDGSVETAEVEGEQGAALPLRGAVVLDPEWLGQKVVGEVLGLGIPAENLPAALQHLRSRTRNGCLRESELRVWLRKVLEDPSPSSTRPGVEIRANFGLQLLKFLQLVVEVGPATAGDSRRIFVPALLPNSDTERALVVEKWLRGASEGHVVGLRFFVSDRESMMLGTGFFEQLQAELSSSAGDEAPALAYQCMALRRNQVSILLCFEHSVDCLQAFVIPVHEGTSMEQAAVQLWKVRDRVLAFAARVRIGVRVEVNVLKPYCITSKPSKAGEKAIKDYVHEASSAAVESHVDSQGLPWWSTAQVGELERVPCHPDGKHLHESSYFLTGKVFLAHAGCSNTPGTSGQADLGERHGMDQEEYPRESGRGFAFVISIDDHDLRPGGQVDRGAIVTALEVIGCRVKEVLNEPAAHMPGSVSFILSDEVEYVASADWIVCVILAHGKVVDNVQHIEGSDGKSIPLFRDLVNPIVTEPVLRGKPKVFLIQACRTIAATQGAAAAEALERSRDLEPHIAVEDEHVLICFSTLHARKAKRHTDTGTPFITALVHEILVNKEVREKQDLHSALSLLNGPEYATVITSTLRKKLFLR